MPKFAANLTLLFNELPFMERFAAAKQAGFAAVEYLFPYAYDKAALAAQLKVHGLTQVLHNLPPGDWEAGDRGIACDPARIDEFRVSVEQALEYATALACPRLNCLAGKLPAGVDAQHARRTLISNLKYAAAKLKPAGMTLLLEPINSFDIPGYLVNRSSEALAILQEVGADNLMLQYDIYHAQRMEGELANTLSKHMPHIGHMQLADNPGRHEPGTGEINYAWLFKHIDALGYTGWIGCEYRPLTTTIAGLDWMRRLA
jgi:hydroxypyruvate isomerase